MSELLPCPLCGADGMVSIVDGYRPSSPKTYQPGCSADCGIYASVEFMSEESAIKWWNRRVPTAPQVAPTPQSADACKGMSIAMNDMHWDTIEVALKNERSALCGCDACKLGRDSIDAALAFVREQRVPTERTPQPIPDKVREAIRRLAAYGIPVGCTNADWNGWRDTVNKWLSEQKQETDTDG